MKARLRSQAKYLARQKRNFIFWHLKINSSITPRDIRPLTWNLACRVQMLQQAWSQSTKTLLETADELWPILRSHPISCYSAFNMQFTSWRTAGHLCNKKQIIPLWNSVSVSCDFMGKFLSWYIVCIKYRKLSKLCRRGVTQKLITKSQKIFTSKFV